MLGYVGLSNAVIAFAYAMTQLIRIDILVYVMWFQI